MKKTVAVLLSVILVCSVFAFSASAETVFGDVDANGTVDSVDVRYVLQVAANLRIVDDITPYDLNNDGFVGASDVRIVLQIAAGIYEGGKPDSVIGTEEEQLAYFVESFNAVKENAQSVTYEAATMYNYNDHFKIDPELEETLGENAASIKEEMLAEFNGERQIVGKTVTGDDIAATFPPANGTCNLGTDDISDIEVKDSGDYYEFTVTVKGKLNPGRHERVGNVATIPTKEDLMQSLDESVRDLVIINCDYKDAVATAKIEKATGNLVEYTVDYPMILCLDFGFGALSLGGFEFGMGFCEEWTATY